MNSSILKQIFLRLNGRIISSPRRQGAEIWVLRKPSAPPTGQIPPGEALTLKRHLMKAFRLASTIMLRARQVERPAGRAARDGISDAHFLMRRSLSNR